MLMLMALLNKNSSVTRITQNKRKTLFLMWFFSLNEITKIQRKNKGKKNSNQTFENESQIFEIIF